MRVESLSLAYRPLTNSSAHADRWSGVTDSSSERNWTMILSLTLMLPNARLLSAVSPAGISLVRSSSNLIRTPKNTNTARETKMMMYINALCFSKNS